MNAKALLQSRKGDNTTILNINTNALLNQSKGDGGRDGRLQSSSGKMKPTCRLSADECESGLQAEDMQKQKTDQQSDQQNRLPQYRHQRCHSGGKGDGGGDGRTSSSTVE
jgi:hypothetical protein